MVAVKRLIQGGVPDSEWTKKLADFHHKANATTRLIHRNIVKTFERGEDEEGSFVATELVDGPNLADYLKLKGGKISTAESASITLGVAQALLYAHKSGVSHGRIKPCNILIRLVEQDDGDSQQITPMVTDFGLGARNYEAESSEKQYSTESRCYLPPGPVQDAGIGSFSSDIYALGKILYELVTGENPDVINPDRIPNISGLADVIFNCTKSNPSDRYSDLDVLIESLKKIGQLSSKSVPLAKADEKSCPLCGAPNDAKARFCMACSSGLTRFCPECGNEGPLDQSCCHACGTDIDEFIKYSDDLASMTRWAGERKWQDIVHLYEPLPQDPKVQGEKGLATQTEVLALRDLAVARLAERDRLDEAARALLADGQLELALARATEALRIDPLDRKPRDGECSLKILATVSEALLTLLRSAKFYDVSKSLEGMSAYGIPECTVDAIAKQIDKEKNAYYEKLNTATSLIQEKQIIAADEMLSAMQKIWPYRAEILVQADLAQRLHYNLEMKIRQAQKAADSKSWNAAFKAARIAVSIEPTDPRASALLSRASAGYYKHRRNRRRAIAYFLLFVFSTWMALRLHAVVSNKRIYDQAIQLAENSDYTHAIAVHHACRSIKWLLVSPHPLPDEIETGASLQRKSEFNALIAEASKAKDVNDWFSCFTLAEKALALGVGENRQAKSDNWMSYRNMAYDSLGNETMIKQANELKADAQRNLIKAAPDMCIELSFVDAGAFMMGSDDGDEDERPARKVGITSYFFISQHETTNKDYDLFISETGYEGKAEADENYLRHKSGAVQLASPGDEYPVVYVSWKNAVRFCEWLTERESKAGRLPTDLVYRLPTEAEWEFSARGGILSGRSKFSGSDSVNDVAWHIGNSNNGTSQVGQKKPNELGIFDMSGNVWEWCYDRYGKYDSSDNRNSSGPESGPGRVCRGGSCLYLAANSRVANRYYHQPHSTDSSLGFRVVIARPVP